METRLDVKARNGTEHGEASGSTLLPMLICGLILIVFGAIGVMTFV